jgi:hypothetical protein
MGLWSDAHAPLGCLSGTTPQLVAVRPLATKIKSCARVRVACACVCLWRRGGGTPDGWWAAKLPCARRRAHAARARLSRQRRHSGPAVHAAPSSSSSAAAATHDDRVVVVVEAAECGRPAGQQALVAAAALTL